MRADLPLDVRHSLADPRELVRALGLGAGAVRQGRGAVLIRCPWHEERHASCSVRVAQDGTIAVKCHGCGATSDALGLVAVVHRLDPRRNFVDVVKRGAELAGRWDLLAELDGTPAERRTVAPVPPRPSPAPEPERDYPPIDEVRALLSRPAWDDVEACAWLRSRGINPVAIQAASVGVRFDGVAVGALAYALDASATLPTWARYRGQHWTETGHRLLVPMVDPHGQLRSVRAARIVEGDSPKRLPPGGHRASGLVMADELGLGLLRGTWAPDAETRVIVRIVEGEPDWLTTLAAPATVPTARIGIVSGAWSAEFAERLPIHCLVAVDTHHDDAGDRYAADIASTLEAAGLPGVVRTAA